MTRVAAVACNSILDRAFGKPKPAGEKDDFVARIQAMTTEERLALADQIIELEASFDFFKEDCAAPFPARGSRLDIGTSQRRDFAEQ
jgi:hypothetical protein